MSARESRLCCCAICCNSAHRSIPVLLSAPRVFEVRIHSQATEFFVQRVVSCHFPYERCRRRSLAPTNLADRIVPARATCAVCRQIGLPPPGAPPKFVVVRAGGIEVACKVPQNRPLLVQCNRRYAQRPARERGYHGPEN